MLMRRNTAWKEEMELEKQPGARHWEAMDASQMGLGFMGQANE